MKRETEATKKGRLVELLSSLATEEGFTPSRLVEVPGQCLLTSSWTFRWTSPQ